MQPGRPRKSRTIAARGTGIAGHSRLTGPTDATKIGPARRFCLPVQAEPIVNTSLPRLDLNTCECTVATEQRVHVALLTAEHPRRETGEAGIP